MGSQDHKPPWFSYGLVLAQFTVIIWIALTGTLLPKQWSLMGILVLGGTLGVWALQTMGIRQVHVFPEVPQGGRLVVQGPYRWVRHPMYTSVLLVTLAWLLTNPTLVRISVWVILIGVLWVKLEYEERLLVKRFPSYPSYQRQTSRLIPFLL